MEVLSCSFCAKNKTAIRCETCLEITCKECSHFIDEGAVEYSFMMPESLMHKTFCPSCYNQKVHPQLEELEAILVQAKNIDIYEIGQSKETRLMRRGEKPYKIEGAGSRDEAQLHLAFLAAKKGFDTLLDTDIRAQKQKMGGSYSKNIWSGSAVPAKLK